MKTTTIYRTILPALCAALLFAASPAMATGTSDAQLVKTVQERLNAASGVNDPQGLIVTAKDGVVTVRGSVYGGLAQMKLVDAAVASVPGVRSVDDQMTDHF